MSLCLRGKNNLFEFINTKQKVINMHTKKITPYKPKNHIRVVTAASLFDGHDAAINVMRRIIQATGVEVIHLGHNRSVREIVDCAVQEDVQAIALTSYQGGHIDFFKYDPLHKRYFSSGVRQKYLKKCSSHEFINCLQTLIQCKMTIF